MKRHKKPLLYLRWIVVGLMVLVLLLSMAVMFVPQIEAWKGQDDIQKRVDLWREEQLLPVKETTVPKDETDETEPAEQIYPELQKAMEEYNREIYINGQKDLKDAWSYTEDVFELDSYGLDGGMVGVISIPQIQVELPLYLGATYQHLSDGFAQLSQTSMPIGGNNTNCVVACHRGWNGLPFMRDVELLEQGDVVIVENLWTTLEYRVRDILIINPDEIEAVLIQSGQDLLTVVTCHPYGVGSHRYVLICERYEQEDAEVVEEETPVLWDWQEANRVTITTTNGEEHPSSQRDIFWQFYFPWLCLGCIAIALAVAGVIGVVVLGCRKKAK